MMLGLGGWKFWHYFLSGERVRETSPAPAPWIPARGLGGEQSEESFPRLRFDVLNPVVAHKIQNLQFLEKR